MKRLLLAGAALVALPPAAAHAQNDVAEVIVTATRAPTPLSEVAAPVSVVTDRDIADRQAWSFAEVLEQVPNVEFFGGPRVQGEMPAIRGATGRQLVILVDGARQNATPSLSTPLYLDPAFISQVEVLKGASSSLYGAGGLGGVMSFSTISPKTLLNAPGDGLGGDARAEVQTGNDGRRLAARVYGRSGAFDGLIGLTHGEWGAIRQGGGGRLRPADGDAQSVLAKAGWQASERLRLELAHLAFDMDDFQPNNPQADASFPYFQRNFARQRQTIARLSRMDADDHESLGMTVYATRLHTGADPNLTVSPALTSSSTTTDTIGFNGGGVWRFSLGAMPHQLSIGADGYRDEIESRTDGLPGTVTPDGRQSSLGAFIRDDIALLPWLSLVPTLRFDRYETELAGATASKTSDERASPTLAAVLRPSAGAMLYLSRGEAFRAPAVNELYQSLSQTTAFANFRPNPDLEPEISREWGLGASWTGGLPRDLGRLSLRADAFQAKVDNLITSVVVGFYTNPFLGRRPIQQYQNVSQAEREGMELEAAWSRGALGAQLGYGQIRVRDRTSGANLFSPPDKWTLGLSYAPSDALSLRWRSIWVEAQDYDSTLIRRRPAYAVHDAFVSWTPTRAWRFDVGLTNLTDERYATYKQSTAYPNVYEQGRSLRAAVGVRF